MDNHRKKEPEPVTESLDYDNNPCNRMADMGDDRPPGPRPRNVQDSHSEFHETEFTDNAGACAAPPFDPNAIHNAFAASPNTHHRDCQVDDNNGCEATGIQLPRPRPDMHCVTGGPEVDLIDQRITSAFLAPREDNLQAASSAVGVNFRSYEVSDDSDATITNDNERSVSVPRPSLSVDNRHTHRPRLGRFYIACSKNGRMVKDPMRPEQAAIPVANNFLIRPVSPLPTNYMHLLNNDRDSHSEVCRWYRDNHLTEPHHAPCPINALMPITDVMFSNDPSLKAHFKMKHECTGMRIPRVDHTGLTLSQGIANASASASNSFPGFEKLMDYMDIGVYHIDPAGEAARQHALGNYPGPEFGVGNGAAMGDNRNRNSSSRPHGEVHTHASGAHSNVLPEGGVAVGDGSSHSHSQGKDTSQRWGGARPKIFPKTDNALGDDGNTRPSRRSRPRRRDTLQGPAEVEGALDAAQHCLGAVGGARPKMVSRAESDNDDSNRSRRSRPQREDAMRGPAEGSTTNNDDDDNGNNKSDHICPRKEALKQLVKLERQRRARGAPVDPQALIQEYVDTLPPLVYPPMLTMQRMLDDILATYTRVTGRKISKHRRPYYVPFVPPLSDVDDGFEGSDHVFSDDGEEDGEDDDEEDDDDKKVNVRDGDNKEGDDYDGDEDDDGGDDNDEEDDEGDDNDEEDDGGDDNDEDGGDDDEEDGDGDDEDDSDSSEEPQESSDESDGNTSSSSTDTASSDGDKEADNDDDGLNESDNWLSEVDAEDFDLVDYINNGGDQVMDCRCGDQNQIGLDRVDENRLNINGVDENRFDMNDFDQIEVNMDCVDHIQVHMDCVDQDQVFADGVVDQIIGADDCVDHVVIGGVDQQMQVDADSVDQVEIVDGVDQIMKVDADGVYHQVAAADVAHQVDMDATAKENNRLPFARDASFVSTTSSNTNTAGSDSGSEVDIVGVSDSESQSFRENQLITLTKGVSLTSSALVPSQSTTSLDQCQDEVDGTTACLPTHRDLMPDNPSFRQFRSLEFQWRFENIFTTSPDSVQSPLPKFNWAESDDVWNNMMKKELTYQRDCGMFKNHPELQPRMRSILLDWLSEVCEVYRLHKETFVLTLDFIDRYLSVTKDVAKTQLQLTGITALFIAAKLEEIYPPKLAEFAYVTDAACSEADIIRQEMIMLKAMKWDLAPMTTNAFLGVYLQLANIDNISDPEMGFVFPQFSTHAFIQISRLCDLCLLDVNSLKYRYSVLTAAALYHHTNEQLVMEVTGFNWADLYPCIKWMTPFAKAILELGQSPIKFFPHVNAEDCHNIQTHNTDMQLLDRAISVQTAFQEQERLAPSSVDFSAQLVELLTPTCKSSPSHSHDEYEVIEVPSS